MAKFIFSRRLARYLIDNGFELLNVQPDKKDITKDVYVFEDTPELNLAIFAFTKAHQVKD